MTEKNKKSQPEKNMKFFDYIDWAIEDIIKDTRFSKLTQEEYYRYWKYGGLAFLVFYLVYGYCAQLICNCIGFAYPFYCSIKALESGKKEDDTKWLTYWVVFAFFSVCDSFSSFLLSRFPFYWLAKSVFLTWCFVPMPWNGSDFLYTNVVRPAFLKHQSKIDKVMSKATSKVQEVADAAKR